jgi:hypothetical protein
MWHRPTVPKSSPMRPRRLPFLKVASDQGVIPFAGQHRRVKWRVGTGAMISFGIIVNAIRTRSRKLSGW